MRRRIIPGDPRRAVGYVRVSTEDQNLGPEAQRTALRAWAARSNVELVGVHDDHGVSGATPLERRPALLAALEQVRSTGAGVLVAAKRDRFARDVVIAATVDRAAQLAGAVLRTSDGASDAAGPEGSMMRGIVDVFAQYEREVIRSRTRNALAVKRSRGERIGAVPFGSRLAADGLTLETDPAERATIDRVLRLRESGRPLREICRQLEAEGRFARSGRPLLKTQVVRILDRHQDQDA